VMTLVRSRYKSCSSGGDFMTYSKFEDLRLKAEAWCREFDRHKDECQLFAERLRVELIEYLGAKSTDVEFHALDEHLDRQRETGTTLSPRLQVGDDGFVYFGLTIFFRLESRCLDEYIRVGVQKSRSQWRVRWNQSEMVYGGGELFFEKAIALIADKFATPFHRRKGPLGFVPVITNDHLSLVPPAEMKGARETAQMAAHHEVTHDKGSA